MRDTGSEKINIEIPRGRGERLEKHSFEIEKVREGGGGGKEGEGPTFSKLVVKKKKKKTVFHLSPRRNKVRQGHQAMRKNRGMEVPVIGIPLRRAIRAIRDAAWKQIRHGEEEGLRRRKSKRTGTRANSFALLHLTRPLCLTGSIPFYPFLFSTTLRPFFLSVPCLCGPTVDSIPFPAILEIRFLSSVHRPLSIFLEFFSIESSNFLSIYLFYFLWKPFFCHSFVAFGEIFRAPRN